MWRGACQPYPLLWTVEPISERVSATVEHRNEEQGHGKVEREREREREKKKKKI